MKNEKLIEQEILEVKDNTNKLYSFLYDLVYKEQSKNINFLERIYRQFLQDNRPQIKRISIYALLFGLKLKNEHYAQVAIENVLNLDNDLDLRLTCLSGLAECYYETKDQKLLTLFYHFFISNSEDSDVRAQSFIGIMKILGMTSIEIMKKNSNKIVVSFDDIQVENFSSELQKVRKIYSDGEAMSKNFLQ